MEEALPLKDELDDCFGKGQLSGEEIDVKINLYRDAQAAVRNAAMDWRSELAKLDINVDDSSLGFDTVEGLIKKYKPSEPPKPVVMGGCEALKALDKVVGCMVTLVDKLPLENFEKLNKFMFKGGYKQKKEKIKDEPKNEEPAVDFDAELNKLKKKKNDGNCFPFCEHTCKNPNEKRKRTRKRMTNALASTILLGAKKGVRSSMAFNGEQKEKSQMKLDDDSEVAPIKTVNCKYPDAAALQSKLKRRMQCFAPVCDARKDFREVVGIHQMKALFPILARIKLKKTVSPKELHAAVKEHETPLFGFTLKKAEKLLKLWKTGSKEVHVDEMLYAIHNSTVYLRLMDESNLTKIRQNIHKWESSNPTYIKRPEIEVFPKPSDSNAPNPSARPGSVPSRIRLIKSRFPKPPSVDVPKPSGAPRSIPSKTRLVRDQFIAAQAPDPSESQYRSITKVIKSQFNTFAKINAFVPSV